MATDTAKTKRNPRLVPFPVQQFLVSHDNPGDLHGRAKLLLSRFLQWSTGARLGRSLALPSAARRKSSTGNGTSVIDSYEPFVLELWRIRAMKRFVSTTIATLIIGITSVCLAQDGRAGNSPPAGKAAARKKANTPASARKPIADADARAPARPLTPAATAQLRAKVHRTMGALVEAQAAERPNEAKIKHLTGQLQEMQARLRYSAQPSPKEVAALRANIHRTIAALATAEAAEKPDEAKIRQLRQQLQTMQTKLQCPQGADFAGQCPMGGRGRGQGQGYGRGRGMGMGMGQGQCYGQGQGQGRGMGQGQCYGQGQGRGQAQGQGRGQGRGGRR